ncbi:MAG: PAS domain S-box protein [Candidatus Humimicrobiaceae bacterium]
MIFLGIEDLNKKIEEKKILELIVDLSEEFLQSSGIKLNYQKICDDILYISGAKYAGFNLYNEDGSKFRTVAFSAPAGVLKKATSLLGFNLFGKKWGQNPVRAEKTKSHTITHFSTLNELAGDLIYKPMASLLEKTFNFGEVVLVKIQKENTIIGDFTLIMPANVKLKNENYVEIYTRQVGLLIVRSKGEAKLIESEKQLRNVFATVSDPLFLFDQKTGAILDVNDIACSLYGYTRDEMLKLKASNMSAEPEITRKSMKDFTTFVPVRYHKKKMELFLLLKLQPVCLS